jgi:hypothetical protein
LDRDEARAPTSTEVPPPTLVSTGSIHRELEKVKFLEFFGASDSAAAEAWLENMAMCFSLHDYTSNMKVLHGGLSTEGECSSMVENTPTVVERGYRRHVMRTDREMVPREVPFRGIH